MSTVVVDTVQQPAWVDRAWQRIVEEVARGPAGVRGLRPDLRATEPAGRPERRTLTAEPTARPTPAAAVEDLYAELVAGPLRTCGSRCCTASCRARRRTR